MYFKANLAWTGGGCRRKQRGGHTTRSLPWQMARAAAAPGCRNSESLSPPEKKEGQSRQKCLRTRTRKFFFRRLGKCGFQFSLPINFIAGYMTFHQGDVRSVSSGSRYERYTFVFRRRQKTHCRVNLGTRWSWIKPSVFLFFLFFFQSLHKQPIILRFLFWMHQNILQHIDKHNSWHFKSRKLSICLTFFYLRNELQTRLQKMLQFVFIRSFNTISDNGVLKCWILSVYALLQPIVKARVSRPPLIHVYGASSAT